MLKVERWAGWGLGLVLGALIGTTVLIGGATFVLLGAAAIALGLLAVRNLAFLSAAFIGVGGTWVVLVVRAQLACEAFDADPNQGCQGFGVGEFLVVSAAVMVVGLVLAALVWRRGRTSRP